MRKTVIFCALLAAGMSFAAVQFTDNFTRADGPETEWLVYRPVVTIEGGRLSVSQEDVIIGETFAWAGRGGQPLYFENTTKVEFSVEFAGLPVDGIGRHGGVVMCGSTPTVRGDAVMNAYTVDWIDRTDGTYDDHGFRVLRIDNGVQTLLAQRTEQIDPPARWRIELSDTGLKLYADDELVTFTYNNDVTPGDDEINETNPLPRSGFVGVWCYINAGEHLYFDDLAVDVGAVTSTCPTFVPASIRGRDDEPDLSVPVGIPYGANATAPYTVTVKTSNSAIAAPVGAVAGSLNVVFAAGAASTKTFDLDFKAAGKTELLFSVGATNCATVPVQVVGTPSATLTEDFTGEPDGTPTDFYNPPADCSPGSDCNPAAVESEELAFRVTTAGLEPHSWLGIGGVPIPCQDIAKISFSIRFSDGVEPTIGKHGGVIFCAQNPTSRWYNPNYTFDYIDRVGDQGFRMLKGDAAGGQAFLANARATGPGSRWSIELTSTTISYFVDDVKIAEVEDGTHRSGYIGFWSYVNTGNEMFIDDIEVLYSPAVCGASISPATVTRRPGDPDPEFTVSIPFGLNLTHAYTVTVASSDPAVAKPAGADAQGKLVLTFPLGGELFQTFGTTIGTVGIATLQLEEAEGDCAPAPATVVVPQTMDSFSDDFERPDGPPGPWTVYAREWAIAGGALGNTRWSGAWPEANIWAGSPPIYFQNVESISATIAFGDSLGDVIGRHGGLTLFAADPTMRWVTSGYEIDWIDRATDQGYRILRFDPSPTPGANSIGTILDQTTTLRPGEFTDPGADWQVDIVGDDISLTVDGEPLLTVTDSTYPKTGFIGFWTYENGSQIVVDDVVIGKGVEPTGTFKRGDVNGDGGRNIADAISLLGHLFGGQAAPACENAADANDDGGLDIADAITILGHLFGGAGPLKPPFDTCGQDPTDDSLDCKSFPPCP